VGDKLGKSYRTSILIRYLLVDSLGTHIELAMQTSSIATCFFFLLMSGLSSLAAGKRVNSLHAFSLE